MRSMRSMRILWYLRPREAVVTWHTCRVMAYLLQGPSTTENKTTTHRTHIPSGCVAKINIPSRLSWPWPWPEALSANLRDNTQPLGERGLGLVVHIPSGYVAKINIPWPWPWPWLNFGNFEAPRIERAKRIEGRSSSWSGLLRNFGSLRSR